MWLNFIYKYIKIQAFTEIISLYFYKTLNKVEAKLFYE